MAAGWIPSIVATPVVRGRVVAYTSGVPSWSRAVKTLHLTMVASVDIAYVVRDTAADHAGLTAPARTIGMRSQGEAEIAIELGATRFGGVSWTTPARSRPTS